MGIYFLTGGCTLNNCYTPSLCVEIGLKVVSLGATPIICYEKEVLTLCSELYELYDFLCELLFYDEFFLSLGIVTKILHVTEFVEKSIFYIPLCSCPSMHVSNSPR